MEQLELFQDMHKILRDNDFHGRYVRKNIKFDPNDGWQRKWVYKVAWKGSGKNIHLVAMTDGMITKEYSKGSFSRWLEENSMVFMTKAEILQFMGV